MLIYLDYSNKRGDFGSPRQNPIHMLMREHPDPPRPFGTVLILSLQTYIVLNRRALTPRRKASTKPIANPIMPDTAITLLADT